MGTFLRYLLSFAVQLAWQRSGRGGAVPPVRLPLGKNKGKTLPLPIIAPWQIMAVLWLGNKIWARYGDHITQQLDQHKDVLLDRLDRVVLGHSKSSSVTPGSLSTGASSITPPAHPATQYHTQPLDDSQKGSTPSPNLPAGSVLSSLRGTS